jgi:hypothetical protein
MRLRALLLALPAVAFSVMPLDAQSPKLGLLIGPSFVGGNSGRVPVETGQGALTGVNQTGLHVRAFADVPVAHTPVSFRVDAFYNRLSRPGEIFALAAGQPARMAQVDRTLGLTANLVVSARRRSAVSPYASLGGGLFGSHLEGYLPLGGWLPAFTPVKAGGVGFGFSAGGGLMIRPWAGPAVVLDWSYFQALSGAHGSGFMPVSFGLRF